MNNRDKMEILDWVHNTLLDRCETIEEARNEIVHETLKLERLLPRAGECEHIHAHGYYKANKCKVCPSCGCKL